MPNKPYNQRLPKTRIINNTECVMCYPDHVDIELWEIEEATPIIDWQGNYVLIRGKAEDDSLHVIAYAKQKMSGTSATNTFLDDIIKQPPNK